MRVTLFAVLLFWFGLIVFYAKAVFGIHIWDEIYFIWDKGKDALFIIAIHAANSKLRSLTRYPLVISLIRFLWEIIADVFGMNVNTREMVNSILIIIMAATTVLLIQEFIKWKRQNYS